jgi:LmbE family N-acetylglucosaminyl deacetylase
MKILVVSAHPDDMEIGMGGTVAKLRAQGHSIVSLVLTDGRRAPNPAGLSLDQMAATRKRESMKAAALLGIESIYLDFESINTKDAEAAMKQRMLSVVHAVQPREVFTLHPELDRHSTHRLAGALTLESLAGHTASDLHIWAYEVWGLFDRWDRFEDVSDYMHKKLEAIAAHQSQLAAIPYAEGVAGLNRWRAVFADPQQSAPPASYAEVFLKLAL